MTGSEEEKKKILSDTTSSTITSTSNPKRSSLKFNKKQGVKKDPKLEKVTEENTNRDFFGVKSYLHQFYDTLHVYKDPDLYEDADLKDLLKEKKRRRCISSIWWKVFVWIGANLLIFGTIGVLVGYLVPRKPITVAETSDNTEIIDNQAINFNMNLEVCKLVGLVLFCIGGLTLTVALLIPSCVIPYNNNSSGGGGGGNWSSGGICDRSMTKNKNKGGSNKNNDDIDDDDDLTVTSIIECEPTSPPPLPIDSLTTVKQVQPGRKSGEAVSSKDGMISISATASK